MEDGSKFSGTDKFIIGYGYGFLFIPFCNGFQVEWPHN